MPSLNARWCHGSQVDVERPCLLGYWFRRHEMRSKNERRPLGGGRSRMFVDGERRAAGVSEKEMDILALTMQMKVTVKRLLVANTSVDNSNSVGAF